MDLQTALANLALSVDDGNCHPVAARSERNYFAMDVIQAIESLGTGGRSVEPEALRKVCFMLFSLILDATRKLEYAYTGTSDLASSADPALAVLVESHNAMLESAENVPGKVDGLEYWRTRAYLLHAMMHRLVEDTHDRHGKQLADLRKTQVEQKGWTQWDDEQERVAKQDGPAGKKFKKVRPGGAQPQGGDGTRGEGSSDR